MIVYVCPECGRRFAYAVEEQCPDCGSDLQTVHDHGHDTLDLAEMFAEAAL